MIGVVMPVSAAWRRAAQIAAFAMDPTSRALLYLSTAFDASVSDLGCALLSGGAAIIDTPRAAPGQALLARLRALRITQLEVRSKYDTSSLKFVAHAAAPVSPPIKRAMIEWWGPVINEYYGSTEMGNVTFCTSAEWLAHPGTVGRVMPGATVKVIDEDGNEMPARGIGEVIGRMGGMADFTYQNDDAKRRSMEKKGLVTPGDVGYFDEDGFLYLCDRASDMIISGGVNIYPQEIEDTMILHPKIADIAVVGVPDPEMGEAVKAVVQLAPGILPSADVAEELLAFAREHIARYKCPKSLDFMDALARLPTGKLYKRLIKDRYWGKMDSRIV